MTRAFEAVSPFDTEPTAAIRLPRNGRQRIDLAALRRSPLIRRAIAEYRAGVGK